MTFDRLTFISEGAGLIFTWLINLIKAVSGYYIYGKLIGLPHVEVNEIQKAVTKEKKVLSIKLNDVRLLS